MRYQTLDQWLQWIESCHPEEIELGLERIKAVYHRLLAHSPSSFDSPIIISVAGTNGKGTCVTVMEHLLLNNGYRVGSYLSPHLVKYNERVRVGGVMVDDQALMLAFDRIDQVLEGEKLTYFEYGTLAALDIFAANNLDYVLLEVGLGGRLDAVNIVDPDVAIVTSIDLDHQAWLGDNREAIGHEKAGIFRQGRPAICADDHPPSTVKKHADAVGAALYQMGIDFSLDKTASGGCWQGVDHEGRPAQFSNMAETGLAIPSVAAALQALLLTGARLSERSVRAVGELSFTGRFQKCLYESIPVILDVAHNPAAAGLLARRLKAMAVKGKIVAVFAVMADKDIDGILAPLESVITQWHLVPLHGQPRAMTTNDLAALFSSRKLDVNSQSEMTIVFNRLGIELNEDDLIIVFGSFYTVAQALAIIEA